MWSARGFAVAGKAALFPSRGSRDPMELSKDSPSTLVNPNIDVRLRDAGQLRHLPDVFHGSTLIPNWEVYAGAQGGHPVVQNRDDAAQHPLLHVVRHQPSSCLGKRPWEHSSGRRWVADESASPCWAVMVSQKPEVAAAPRTPKGRCLAGCSAHRPDAFAQVISEEDETGPLVSVTATASRRRDCSLVVSDRACAQTAAWLDRAARASGPRVSLEAKHCLREVEMASGTVRELLELHRTHLVTGCELSRHAALLSCCSDVLNLSCPLHPSLLCLEAEDLRACRHHFHAIWQFPTQGAVRRRSDDQQMPVTQGGWACGDHNQELAAMPPKPRWIAAELSRVACLSCCKCDARVANSDRNHEIPSQ